MVHVLDQSGPPLLVAPSPRVGPGGALILTVLDIVRILICDELKLCATVSALHT
jgi:hypothetical protein